MNFSFGLPIGCQKVLHASHPIYMVRSTDLFFKKKPLTNKWFRYRLQICIFSSLVIGWWSKLGPHIRTQLKVEYPPVRRQMIPIIISITCPLTNKDTHLTHLTLIAHCTHPNSLLTLNRNIPISPDTDCTHLHSPHTHLNTHTSHFFFFFFFFFIYVGRTSWH